MPKANEIVVACYRDGYRAFLKNNSCVYGFGWDYKEAVGDLIVSHPDLFDCVVVLPPASDTEPEPFAAAPYAGIVN